MQVSELPRFVGLCWLVAVLALQSRSAKAAEDVTVGNAEGRHFDAMKELPAGEGKALTAVACTRCHDLAGLQAYKGYWNREQWLAMVESMVKNGAKLDAIQRAIVTDYLNNNFGRSTHE